MLDHLLLVTPDFPRVVARVERLTGIIRAPGCEPPGADTRNYLLGISSASATAYLENTGANRSARSAFLP
jgi:hypothetical protein